MVRSILPSNSGGRKWVNRLDFSQKPNTGKGPVSPRSAAWAPRAPVKGAPASRPKRNAPVTSRSGGSQGGSGGGGGGGGAVGFAAPMPAPEPAAPTEKDWLAGDKTYAATMASLSRQLKDYMSNLDAQLSSRKLDYNEAVKDLGYTPGLDGAAGAWNYEDNLTASGRAYQAMLNDYAARGMIQGSGFADAQNDLTRTLNDQYQGMNRANTQYIEDSERQRTQAKSENEEALNAARAESILRRAMKYGIGA